MFSCDFFPIRWVRELERLPRQYTGIFFHVSSQHPWGGWSWNLTHKFLTSISLQRIYFIYIYNCLILLLWKHLFLWPSFNLTFSALLNNKSSDETAQINSFCVNLGYFPSKKAVFCMTGLTYLILKEHFHCGYELFS